MTEIELLRTKKDRFFKLHPNSPLTAEQQREFEGLSYFPENPELSLEAEVEEFAEKSTVVLQTSAGEVQSYLRYGRLKIEIEGQPVSLTLFASESGDNFFLPFSDSLAGTETYGAGRYLELGPLPNGKFLLDFNRAYNPYCAYNESWSCPLTPAENRLKIPIRAGEKVFASHN